MLFFTVFAHIFTGGVVLAKKKKSTNLFVKNCKSDIFIYIIISVNYVWFHKSDMMEAGWAVTKY